MRRLLLAFTAALFAVFVPSASADYGIDTFKAALSSEQAGAHPDFTTEVKLTGKPGTGAPFGTTETLSFDLPPGIVGNPAAFPKCTATELVVDLACPQDSQVGVSFLTLYALKDGGKSIVNEPVFNMESPGGDVAARFGLVAYAYPVFVDIRLNPRTGYGLTATASGLSSKLAVSIAKTTFWGVPADPSHDGFRITPFEAASCGGTPCTAPGGLPRESGLPPVPFMSSPTRCGDPGTAGIAAMSYQQPGVLVGLQTPLMPMLSGCSLLDFNPQISLVPSSSEAESPAGVEAELSLPQAGLGDPQLLATAHLKRSVVTLPRGATLNPAAATGLGACSESQIGLVSESPIRFDAAPAVCPSSSKVGTAEVDTPILQKPLKGDLYIARPGDNPFNTLLAGYLVVEDQGVRLKVPGRFEADPQTGQITAVFNDNPQQPFSSLRLHFKGGDRGVLITPRRCGTYAIESKLSPWSAMDPENPTAAEINSSSSSFSIDSGPDEGPCPTGRFEPSFEMGTTNPTAGGFSPLELHIARSDGMQRLVGLTVSPPPGLLGKLAGMSRCQEAAITRAESRVDLGSGAAEVAEPSCPPASRVGRSIVEVGAGPTPLSVETGSVYLAGPYKGAPISLAIVTPAVAGPFDLGNAVVRIALRVDPATARITAVSDPLPTMLHGIALSLRDARIVLDRPEFIVNPTNCEPTSALATAQGAEGRIASLSSRFQIANCANLGFRPALSLKLIGGTKRGGHPLLRAVVRPRAGDANIANASVTLPRSAFLDQAHIRTICTRVQFAANACPAASIYGHATARTPLLDEQVEGNVYLRSSNHKLPDLVIALKGPPSLPIDFNLVGRVDSVKGGIRSSFETTPDVPVTEFVLTMQGGKKGLVVNSRNLCAGINRAKAKFVGHNGGVSNTRPKVVATKCGEERGKRAR